MASVCFIHGRYHGHSQCLPLLKYKELVNDTNLGLGLENMGGIGVDFLLH